MTVGGSLDWLRLQYRWRPRSQKAIMADTTDVLQLSMNLRGGTVKIADNESLVSPREKNLD